MGNEFVEGIPADQLFKVVEEVETLDLLAMI
jgi:hypothetical protein